MPNRRKLFLVLVLICTAPLLVLSGFLFWTNLNIAKRSLRESLENELVLARHSFKDLLTEREQERVVLATSTPIVAYVTSQPQPSLENTTPTADRTVFARVSVNADGPDDAVSDVITAVVANQKAYAAIAGFRSGGQLLFLAEQAQAANRPVILRTKDFLPRQSEPDPQVWTAKQGESVCRLVDNNHIGKTLRCGTPIYGSSDDKVRGALVTDLKLHTLLTEVARRSELAERNATNGGNSASGLVAVLDKAGEIVYHTNDAVRHQQATSSTAGFGPVAQHMMAGEAGAMTYESAGANWLAVYAPLESADLSLVIARNSSRTIEDARRTGWIGIALATLFGMAMAAVLTNHYQRKSRSIERVTEDVAAIAKGELDLEVQARSRDDMRPLADSVNLVTKRLREQIARESETRQFQAFVRLSAMLTHDLKNAIGGLSLMVSNMEEHYANEQFRVDAMRSLTLAAEKLKSLVERISHPVTALSGEFKRPSPVDLAPLIRRVISETIGRVSGTHHLNVELPASLFALVDDERIEKVIENLVLNGFEAMRGKPGTLTVKAGREGDGKVFFSIGDSGVGISQRFIDEKLFHAFATTKQSGMGLGLYTCREVVWANGGTIEVVSKVGDGTTFRVVLPSAPSEERP